MKSTPAKTIAFHAALPAAAPDPQMVATIVAAVIAALSAVGVTRPAFQTPSLSQDDIDPSLTLSEAINVFIVSRYNVERSDRYLRQLRVSLASFAKGRTKKPLLSLTQSDVEKWLLGSDWSPRTMRNYLADLRSMLSYCVRRGWMEEKRRGQITFVELPPDKARLEPIVIHTPEEVKAVLETARAVDLDVMRKLAIRYFAGVRTAESHRMGEENILHEAKKIEVTRAQAKGTVERKRRRLIAIKPCLEAWLALGGVLYSMNDQRVRNVVRLSGVKWHDNVTRHTWESYRVADCDDQAETARESGHSVAVQKEHYDAVALPEDAKRFFAIVPDPEPWKVRIPRHGGARPIVRSDDKRRD